MAKPGPSGHHGYNGSYSSHIGHDFASDPQSQILIPLLSPLSYVALVSPLLCLALSFLFWQMECVE